MKKLLFLSLFCITAFFSIGQPFMGAGDIYFNDSLVMQAYVPSNTGSKEAILRRSSTENRIFQYKGTSLKWVELLGATGAGGGTVFRTNSVTPTTANVFPLGVPWMTNDRLDMLRNGSMAYRSGSSWIKNSMDNGFNVPNSLRVTAAQDTTSYTANLNKGNRFYFAIDPGVANIQTPDSLDYQGDGEIFVYQLQNVGGDTCIVVFENTTYREIPPGTSTAAPLDTFILASGEQMYLNFQVTTLGEILVLQVMSSPNREWVRQEIAAGGDGYVKIEGDSMTGVLGIRSNSTPGYYPEEFPTDFIYGLDIGKTPYPDSSMAGLGVKNYINRVDVDSTELTESFASTFYLYPNIPTSKHWKLGQATTLYLENLRNYNPSPYFGNNNDNGKLALSTGLRMLYGHYNSDLTATPRTTGAIGLNVYPYINTGLIDNMYDVFLQTANSGGTATNHYGIYQQDVAIKNYFGGQVSVGSENPYGEIQATQTTTNTTDFGIVSELNKSTTTTGNHSSYNLYNFTYPKVSSGQSNTGSVIGVYTENLRNMVGAGDNGTLTNLFGGRVLYGHANTEVGATPTTTNMYGLFLYPFARTGTISNLYDLFISTPNSGGSISDHYSIFQQATTSKNYFGGKNGVNVINPTAKIHIAANTSTSASQAAMKFDLTSAVLMTSPEIGALEPVGDRINYTIPTGTTREQIAYLSDITGGGGDLTAITATLPLTVTSGTGPIPDVALTGIVPIANGGTGSASQTAWLLSDSGQVPTGNKRTTGTFHQGSVAAPTGSSFGSTDGTYNYFASGTGLWNESNFADTKGFAVYTQQSGTGKASTILASYGSDTGNIGSTIALGTRVHGITTNLTFPIIVDGLQNLLNGATGAGGQGTCINGKLGIEDGGGGSWDFDATISGGGTLDLAFGGSIQAFMVQGGGGVWTPSDKRLKTQIRELSVLDNIEDMRGVRYTFKKSGKKSIGVIAQEIQKFFPEAVTESSNGFLAVDYQAIAAIALQGAKENKEKIDLLENQLFDLHKRLENLETQAGIIPRVKMGFLKRIFGKY